MLESLKIGSAHDRSGKDDDDHRRESDLDDDDNIADPDSEQRKDSNASGHHEVPSGERRMDGIRDRHQSGTQSHTYQLIVYFTDTHATVIGSAKTSVAVAGKAVGTWSVSAKFPAPWVVKCVLVGAE